ncbi:MAG: class I SAM-dependent methyltransferase [Gaiellaceae bacterium]
MSYDAGAIAAFFDSYGEREWQRFEDGRTPSVSAATHIQYLRRFVGPGDRVLDVGCGPGRFTIELARLGARVVAADVSPVQLELHRQHVAEEGFESAVEERAIADVVDLSAFADDEFDVTVCYGGAISYVLDEAPLALAELARVTSPGGHVLLSVMALVGSLLHAYDAVLEIASLSGAAAVRGVTQTGHLPRALGGHLPMKLYRSRELSTLLALQGEVVAMSATGLFRDTAEHAELLEELELDLGSEPGVVDAGHHILAVVRV